ncbi:PD-(D/E)XK nuclease family protein [Sulfurovum sp. AR]|uniref:PDDEXK-like family protein n=1 Tax=Sulfurovum sp. AR TaxID=1165841 RepID=UPI00025C4CBD|nr:PD-(D/E)XK nuclease family protein [Sulfurovum sp. AR]EIF51365.1 hypothetical protein SULAR_03937 [Sulfurovum sp. AR]
MSKTENKLAVIENFIYNDDISVYLQKINQSFLDFNVLEITGMGAQEIKHSSVLSWMLGDNEHNQGYGIFIDFLKKIYLKNNCNDKKLQEYIYISTKYNLNVYRERDDIDILIEDEKNKKIFVIENKVYSRERRDGEDGGQLEKYEKKVKSKYPKYDIYYIFLTPNFDDASKEHWLKADYEMISNIITDILIQNELSSNTKLVFESYTDLLKRRNIVENREIQELCEKIWANKEYSKALDILYNYRVDIKSEISDYLQDKLSQFQDEHVEVDLSNKNLIRFADIRWDDIPGQKSGKGQWTKSDRVLLYEFYYTASGLTLKLIIGPGDELFREDIFRKLKDLKNFNPGKNLALKWNTVWTWKKSIISQSDIDENDMDILKNKIDIFIEDFFREDGQFNQLSTIILELLR